MAGVTGVTGKPVTGLDTTTPKILEKQAKAGEQLLSQAGSSVITKAPKPVVGSPDAFQSAKVKNDKSVLGDNPSVIASVNKATLGVQKDLQSLAPKTVANAPVPQKTVANAPVDTKKTTTPAVADFANLAEGITKKSSSLSPLSKSTNPNEGKKTTQPAQTTQAVQPKDNKKEQVQATQVPTKKDPVQATQVPAKKDPVQATQVPTKKDPVQATQAPTKKDPVQATQVPTKKDPVPSILPQPKLTLGTGPDNGLKSVIANALSKKGDSAPTSQLSSAIPAIKKDAGKVKDDKPLVFTAKNDVGKAIIDQNAGKNAAPAKGSVIEQLQNQAASTVSKTQKPVAAVQTDVKKDL